jgi:hypothetical protein
MVNNCLLLVGNTQKKQADNSQQPATTAQQQQDTNNLSTFENLGIGKRLGQIIEQYSNFYCDM